MSDEQSRPADEWDPLTSPYWEPRDDVDAIIAPPVEEFTGPEVQVSRTIPQPPDVDEILRGEYTGWVPIIKPGDTVEAARIRFEEEQAKRETSYEEMFESKTEEALAANVHPEDLTEIKELIREMKSEPDVYVKDFYPNLRDIAKDPDTVSSPAQALEEARRRIEQMRANLQVNLSRVQQSFDHPIFEPKTVEEHLTEFAQPEQTEEVVKVEQTQPKVEFKPFELPETTPVVFDYIPVETPITVEDVIEDEPETEIHDEQIHHEEPIEQPQVNQPLTQTTVVNEEPKIEDHSLELVIMRDEIKDLRDRLDASQRLIENLMERLANLAELALQRRD
jgi:hypothetical protein